MYIRITLCLVLMAVLTASTISVQADEPTWLFTVPKAETLDEGYYTLGFVHADFGVAENLEIGIHGLKYSMPESNLAFGVSLFPMATPYLVLSLDATSGRVHMGLKAAPYIVFAGFEIPISDKVKFVAELNNGAGAGVRIFPQRNWTLDIFAAFFTVQPYKYRYSWIEIEDFYPIPGLLVAYSGKL